MPSSNLSLLYNLLDETSVGGTGSTRNSGTTSTRTTGSSSSTAESSGLDRWSSGSHNRPSALTLATLLGDNSTLSNFLGIAGVNGAADNNKFLQLLLLLASGNLNRPGTDDDDIQSKLIDMLLDNLVKNEQRDYDKSVLSDQRNYDSPAAQIARLTAAGISRNQAIQMLQGAQDPALVGSGSDVTSGEPLPSPSDKLMSGISAGLDIIGTVGSLISLGFSAPAAIQQVKMLTNQNALTSLQLGAYEDVSLAHSILTAAGAGAESFSNVANAGAAISKLAESGNVDATNFISQGRLQRMQNTSYFSSRSLNDLWKSERASSDYDTSFGLYVESTNADIDFKKADKRRVEQQILNLGAELIETQSSTEFINSQIALQKFHEEQLKAQTDLLRKQGKEIDANILESKARVNLLNSQTKTNDLNNQYTEGVFTENIEGKSGLDWLTQSKATEIYNDCQKFVKSKDKKIWEKELNFIAADYDRLYQLELMRQSYMRGAIKKYNNDPEFQDIIHVCTAMQECGAWSYLQFKLDAIKGKYPTQGFADPALRSIETRDLLNQFGF